MQKKQLIISVLLTSLISTTFCSNEIALVDAGSTGSRLYIYQYQVNGDQKLPTLTLEYSNKVKPGIEGFTKNPTDLDAYLKKLLGNQGTKHANFYLMGTAGMRALSQDSQQAIYKEITQYIKNNTNFSIRKIETITGQWEGAFDWISANYWQNTLTTNKTIGILDLGGGSVEIAYQTANDREATMQFNLAGQTYKLVSKSDLGLGMNSSISQYLNDQHCFPSGYKLPDTGEGLGNSDQCKTDSLSLTNAVHHVDTNTAIIPKDMPFIATSGYYYTAKALGLPTRFTLSTFLNAARSFCSTKWATLKQLHPNDAYLHAYCFDASYIDGLLENGYKFEKSKEIKATNNINQHDLDWTTGAALYFSQSNLQK